MLSFSTISDMTPELKQITRRKRRWLMWQICMIWSCLGAASIWTIFCWPDQWAADHLLRVVRYRKEKTQSAVSSWQAIVSVYARALRFLRILIKISVLSCFVFHHIHDDLYFIEPSPATRHSLPQNDAYLAKTTLIGSFGGAVDVQSLPSNCYSRWNLHDWVFQIFLRM